MQVKVSDTGKLSQQAQPGVSVTMTSALPLVGKLRVGPLDPFRFPSSLPPSTRSWKWISFFPRILVAKSGQRNTDGSSRTENSLSHKKAKSWIKNHFCSLPFSLQRPQTHLKVESWPDCTNEATAIGWDGQGRGESCLAPWSPWVALGASQPQIFLFHRENNPLACLSHSALGFLLVATRYIPAC